MPEPDPLSIRDEFCSCILSHDYSKGPLLLLAGPGTGKTYNLLETIKCYIEEGLIHSDFFEATLTKAAASDFIDEAKKSIAPDFESSSTLHHRAKGILHHYSGLINLDSNFTIMDETLEKITARNIGHILGMSEDSIEGEIKNHKQASATLVSTHSKFSLWYYKFQFFFSAIDWYDVVKLACKILDQYREVKDIECSRFRFLMIDEYQDLNPAEQHFVELLIDDRTTLLVAGDDDQSIYGHRYADVNGILEFHHRYPGSTMKALPVTSRLPTAIVDASHSLIAHNEIREDKAKLLPLDETNERSCGGFVISVNIKSGKAEREFIPQAIATLIENRVHANRILVLCNCKALGNKLVDSILTSDSTFSIQNDLGSEIEVDDVGVLIEHIENFLAALDNNLCLIMILEKVLSSNNDDLDLLVQHSLKNNKSLWYTIVSESIQGLSEDSVQLIHSFVEVIHTTLDLDETDQLKYVITEIQSLNFLLEHVRDESLSEDESEVVNHSDEDIDGVRFLTIHSSKGLNADYVFIPFMEKSLTISSGNIDERRRLLYVALTRAKVGVIFSWAWSRQTSVRYSCYGTGGDFRNRKPSPFISECGVSPSLTKPYERQSSIEIALAILSESAAHVIEYDETHMK